ncbi:hypothetical protein [Acetobacterium bakii]|nr:hypothetical protein [Acetobacterium bakii]
MVAKEKSLKEVFGGAPQKLIVKFSEIGALVPEKPPKNDHKIGIFLAS